MGASPSPVSPWQVPTRLLGQGRWHEIKSRRSPWVASQDASESHPTTCPESKAVNGFVRVFRAARQMPAARPDQRRQRDPIERNKAAASQAGQPSKCLMVRIENHSSSSGSLDWPVRAGSSIAKPSQWNFSPFGWYSDFFTLDPNLASALRTYLRGGI